MKGRHQRERKGERATATGRDGERGGRAEIVFGVEPVRELIVAAPEAVRTLNIRRGDERRFANEIEQVRAARGSVAMVDEAALERLTGRGARHQGIVATISHFQYVDLDELIERRPDPLVVIDGVTDPRNLGALMRSAEGAGVRALVIARDRTVAVTPAAVKTSAGAWSHLAIAQCGNVVRTLGQLKERGYWVAALAPDGAVSIYDLDVTRPIALVVGSEDAGVRPLVRRTSDFVVAIPMRGRVASLNVSVAAAVALFEVARRRAVAPPSASL
ncbi:MAG: 23S rRNA (guanosine(2251)-2'-O)-methyltransferase RlmB [Candidatus Binataceae bacterium]